MNVPKLQNLPKPSEITSKIEPINGVIKKQNPSTSSSSNPYKIPSGSRYNSSNSSRLNSAIVGLNSTTAGLSSSTSGLSSAVVDPTAGASRPVTSNKNDVLSGSSAQNGAIPRTKRTNDQPQVNTAGDTVDKVKKDLW